MFGAHIPRGLQRGVEVGADGCERYSAGRLVSKVVGKRLDLAVPRVPFAVLNAEACVVSDARLGSDATEVAFVRLKLLSDEFKEVRHGSLRGLL